MRWGGNGSGNGSGNGASGMTTMRPDGDLRTVARNISSAFPVTVDEDTCDVSASNDGTKGGVGATIGGRMYLDGMPDPAVKIDQKSYDAGNPRDLARCRHMALVGCSESFSVFRRSLTGSRL